MPAKPIDELRDLIPRFLAGELSPQEDDSFRLGMSEHPELQSETEELRNLKAGLEIYEQVSLEHIGPENLVAYAQTPRALSNDTIADIESHLKACESCREEVDLTCEAFATQAETRGQAESSFLSNLLERLRQVLLPPKLVLRPIYAYVAVLALLVPTYIVIRGIVVVGEGIAVVDIDISGSRGELMENVATIRPDTKTLRLTFPAFPAKKNHLYNLILRDKHGRVVTAWYGRTMTEENVFEVPAALLTANQYFIEFEELDGSEVSTDTFAPVTLKIDRKE